MHWCYSSTVVLSSRTSSNSRLWRGKVVHSIDIVLVQLSLEARTGGWCSNDRQLLCCIQCTALRLLLSFRYSLWYFIDRVIAPLPHTPLHRASLEQKRTFSTLRGESFARDKYQVMCTTVVVAVVHRPLSTTPVAQRHTPPR